MIKKIIIGLVAILFLLGLLAIGVFQYYKSPQVFEPSVGGLYNTEPRLEAKGSQRNISQGSVIGFEDNYRTYAWLGVPYAKAPIDELRWRAPQPAPAWTEPLSATEYGEPCIQFWGALAATKGESGDLIGSEDCLTLNIWAPRNTAPAIVKPQEVLSGSAPALKPTMVWIHGGGNDSGTGRMYQGHHLAGSQDVVVVTINYRLGLLGWFSHDAVRATADNPLDGSGNFGTLDIIEALKWVQNNIAEFGGDPSNVTIFGESAGGRNVYSMLASPLASGLFDKAIIQSGTLDTTLLALAENFPEEPNEQAVSGLKNSSSALIELALKRLDSQATQAQLRSRINSANDEVNGAELMTVMRNMSARELMHMAADNSGAKGRIISVARVLRDGFVIPKESLLSLFQNTEKYNSVPMITGTTRDEQKVFMIRNPKYIDMKLGAIPVAKDPVRYQRVSEYVSQNWKAGAVDEPAKVITKAGQQSVYAYRFDWDDMISNLVVDMPSLLGAAHGMETNYVFGDFIGGMPFDVTYSRQNADGRKKLSKEMMSYWAEFAYSGAPNRGRQGELPLWGEWQDQGDNLMLFDAPSNGGSRMAEVRTNVADIKQMLLDDFIIISQKDKCEAYAALFLHGYQTSDFYQADEYQALGCQDYPVGLFR